MSKKRDSIVVLLGGILLPILLGLIIYFFLRPHAPREYTTLTEITAYVSRLEEFVKPDGNDYEDPHFLSFYKKRNPTLLGYALQKLGLWQRPPSSPLYLAQLVTQITRKHHENNVVDGEHSFIHINAQKDTKFFVFGDIHGALHSLVRDLNYLHQSDILSEELKIKDKDAYIIFNGDLIDRSSYSIDCLIIVSYLMKQNPDRVIYIAGKHERHAYWKDYSLKRELTNRANFYSAQDIPFFRELTDFFASLPAAVYLSGAGNNQEMIRISFFDKHELSFDETRLDTKTLMHKNAAKIYHINDMPENSQAITVRAAIKTEDWRHDNRIHNGIGLLEQTDGAINWGVLSSPTLVHKKFLDFHDDAFALVSLPGSLETAKISAIHKPINGPSFLQENPLNMLSGRPVTEEKSLKDIRIGSSISLVRGIAIVGKQVAYGLNTRVRAFNTDEKHQGNVIRLNLENDDFVPRFAHHVIEKQLASGIRYFLMPLGNETVITIKDLVKDNNAGMFFPRAQSTELRRGELTSIIHFLASDEDEARILTRFMHKDGALKFAFFYQDDALNKAQFLAAVDELKKIGITNIQALPYKQGSFSFSTQAESLRRDPPDALGLFANVKAAKELIRQVGVKELLATNLFATSSSGEIQFRRFIAQKGLNIRFSSSVPNPLSNNKAISLAFQKAMNADRNIIDVFSFEAFIAASLFIEALDNTSNPSPEKLLRFFASMRHKNFHDLRFNFNPQTRSLATQVFIETSSKEEWKEYDLPHS